MKDDVKVFAKDDGLIVMDLKEPSEDVVDKEIYLTPNGWKQKSVRKVVANEYNYLVAHAKTGMVILMIKYSKIKKQLVLLQTNRFFILLSR